jgi:enoyl-CoA hydratase/carnithine racemase
VVITGAGSAFSAGDDLAFLQELSAMPPARIRVVVYGTLQRVPRAIRSTDKPVVAAVNGAAVGAGCEIAVACDFRIASSLARFGGARINLGCVPALGGMFLLPRIVGPAKATELVMTGEIIDAVEALRIGLVNKVVMPPDLPRAAFELAQRPARGPARALAAAKTALNRGLDSTFLAEVEATLEQQPPVSPRGTSPRAWWPWRPGARPASPAREASSGGGRARPSRRRSCGREAFP